MHWSSSDSPEGWIDASIVTPEPNYLSSRSEPLTCEDGGPGRLLRRWYDVEGFFCSGLTIRLSWQGVP